MINIRDAEHDKFFKNTSNETVVRIGSGGVPLGVTFTTNGTVTNTYSEINIAAANIATVVTYTVPAGKELLVDLVEFSGTNIANYEVQVSGVAIAKKRTWFGGDLSGQFLFNKLLIDESTIFRLRVDNFRPSSADFEGRILGVLRDK